MGGGSSGPKPDKNIGVAAKMAAQTGQDYLNWAKTNSATMNKWAAEDRARAKSQQGYQDKFLKRSSSWAYADRKTFEANQKELQTQQARANKWAVEDRSRANANNRSLDAYQKTTQQWATEDRARQARLNKAQDSLLATGMRESAADRAYYERTFKPIEQKMARDASVWDSRGRQANAADEAAGDVMAAGARAKQQSDRALAAQGAAPGSGRAVAASRGLSLDTGLAAVGARNIAKKSLINEAQNMRGGVANMGSGIAARAGAGRSLPLSIAGQNTGALGTLSAGAQTRTSSPNPFTGLGMATGIAGQGDNSLNSMGAGVNLTMGGAVNPATSAGLAGNIMSSGANSAQSGYQTQGSLLNTQYQQQQQQYQNQQNSSSGLFGAIGSVAGATSSSWMPLLMAASSEDIKTKKRPVRGLLPAMRKMRVEEWEYTPENAANVGDKPGNRHIGTYAGDFAKATGKGDGEAINMMDAVGVTMGAIKELDAKVTKMARGLPARAAA